MIRIRRALSTMISILIAASMLVGSVWAGDLRFVGGERKEQKLLKMHSLEQQIVNEVNAQHAGWTVCFDFALQHLIGIL